MQQTLQGVIMVIIFFVTRIYWCLWPFASMFLSFVMIDCNNVKSYVIISCLKTIKIVSWDKSPHSFLFNLRYFKLSLGQILWFNIIIFKVGIRIVWEISMIIRYFTTQNILYELLYDLIMSSSWMSKTNSTSYLSW